jgi:hypothetical protein
MYNLSDFFKTLKERFSKGFNHQAGCSGAFWSERFKSILLSPDAAVLSAIGAYIELNPVRAGIVKSAEDYPFSGLGAASKGDEYALAGIRELLDPSFDPSHAAATGPQADILFRYKRVLEGYLPADPASGVEEGDVKAVDAKKSNAATKKHAEAWTEAVAVANKGTKKVTGTKIDITGETESAEARARRAAALRRKTRVFLEGAVFGTLRFVASFALLVLEGTSELRRLPGRRWNDEDGCGYGFGEYYSARRVNRVR